MTTGLLAMDKELLQLVSESAGRAAGQEIVVELRAEIAEQFSNMKSQLAAEIDSKFSNHFGDIKPSKHIIHHDRLDRGIRWFDHTLASIGTKIVFALITAAGVLAGGMWALSKVVAG